MGDEKNCSQDVASIWFGAFMGFACALLGIVGLICGFACKSDASRIAGFVVFAGGLVSVRIGGVQALLWDILHELRRERQK